MNFATVTYDVCRAYVRDSEQLSDNDKVRILGWIRSRSFAKLASCQELLPTQHTPGRYRALYQGDGADVVSDIAFDQIMKNVLSSPGDHLETTTPPMALIPPNAPFVRLTNRAADRIFDIDVMSMDIFHVRNGEFKSTARAVDIKPFFAPHGNKMIRPALAEQRTNVASDLFIERPELEQYALQVLGLNYLDRQLSTPLIRASINRWMFKLVTGNDIEFPKEVSFVEFLKAITA